MSTPTPKTITAYRIGTGGEARKQTRCMEPVEWYETTVICIDNQGHEWQVSVEDADLVWGAR